MLVRPPRKKAPPITMAARVFLSWTILAATKAPTRVPKAWAINGARKCLGSKRCIVAFRPSMVVVSAPSGGGINAGPRRMIPILTRLPMIRPPRIARVVLASGFIDFIAAQVVFYYTRKLS